jgi:hypothetical protein
VIEERIMKVVRAWFVRLFGVFESTRAEQELSAEIESHLQLHVADNMRAGMSPRDARRRAVLALGGVERCASGCAMLAFAWRSARRPAACCG